MAFAILGNLVNLALGGGRLAVRLACKTSPEGQTARADRVLAMASAANKLDGSATPCPAMS